MLQAVRRRWRTCVAVLVSCILLSALLTALLPQTYQAHAQVIVRRTLAESGAGTGEAVMATDVAIAHSPPIAHRVVEDLSLDETTSDFLDRYTSTAITDDVMQFTVRAPSAREAARTADTLVAEFLGYRREQSAARVATVANALNPRIDDINRDLNEVASQISAALAELPREDRAIGTPEIQSLQANQQSLVDERTSLTNRINELELDESVANEGTRAVAAAELPKDPSSPNVMINRLLGVILGLAGGIGFVAFSELLTDKLRKREDFAHAAGVPVVASAEFPGSVRFKPGSTRAARLLARPDRGLSRAVRQVAGELDLRSGTPTSLLFCSVACDGESAVMVGSLAISMTGAGLPTLLGDFSGSSQPMQALLSSAGQLDDVPNFEEFDGDFSASSRWFAPSVKKNGDGAIVSWSHVSPKRAVNAKRRLEGNGHGGRQKTETALGFLSMESSFDLLPQVAEWFGDSVLVVRAGGATRTAIRRHVDTLAHVGAPVRAIVLVRPDPDDETSGYLDHPVSSLPELSSGG